MDLPQVVNQMGFRQAEIRRAVRRKVERTGLPFFSIQHIIDAVVEEIEEHPNNDDNHLLPQATNTREPESIVDELRRTTPPGSFRLKVEWKAQDEKEVHQSLPPLIERPSCKLVYFSFPLFRFYSYFM